jgi:hypothetical protein
MGQMVAHRTKRVLSQKKKTKKRVQEGDPIHLAKCEDGKIHVACALASLVRISIGRTENLVRL